MKFKKLSNREEVNLVSYVKEYLQKYPDTKIGISCDSQNKGPKIAYATVVILYREGKGGHILYNKQYVKRNIFGKKSEKDFAKLFKESELSALVAEMLLDNRDIITVALDYNKDPYYFSNSVLMAAIGWFKGNGIKVNGKPHPYTHVPDKIVRGF